MSTQNPAVSLEKPVHAYSYITLQITGYAYNTYILHPSVVATAHPLYQLLEHKLTVLLEYFVTILSSIEWSSHLLNFIHIHENLS